MLAGWAALALATLTKGLVAIVLPAATVVVYSLWQRDWGLWKKLHLFKGAFVLAGDSALVHRGQYRQSRICRILFYP